MLHVDVIVLIAKKNIVIVSEMGENAIKDVFAWAVTINLFSHV